MKQAKIFGSRKPSPTTGRGFGVSRNDFGKPFGGTGISYDFGDDVTVAFGTQLSTLFGDISEENVEGAGLTDFSPEED